MTATFRLNICTQHVIKMIAFILYLENRKVISKLMVTLYEGLDARKSVFGVLGGGGVANNKGADQSAHQCNLVSAFVIRSLKSIISRIALSEISISIYLVPVAGQAGLNVTFSET